MKSESISSSLHCVMISHGLVVVAMYCYLGLSLRPIVSHWKTSFQCFSVQYYYYYNCFMAVCPGLPGWAGTRRIIHPLNYPDHHPTFISFFHLLWSIASSRSIYVLDDLFAQTLSKSSLVYLLLWSPPPHIAYISSPNQCLIFAAHAHTIATCFAVVSRLYHLFLICLSTLYLGLYLLL